jgi:hypothetical protein
MSIEVVQKCGHDYKRISDAVWETLHRFWSGDEELAWGGGTSIKNKHKEFFTPPESLKRDEFEPSKIDHNPKVNNVPRPLWGNFCPSTSGSTRWLCSKAQMLPMKDECECMSSY